MSGSLQRRDLSPAGTVGNFLKTVEAFRSEKAHAAASPSTPLQARSPRRPLTGTVGALSAASPGSKDNKNIHPTQSRQPSRGGGGRGGLVVGGTSQAATVHVRSGVGSRADGAAVASATVAAKAKGKGVTSNVPKSTAALPTAMHAAGTAPPLITHRELLALASAGGADAEYNDDDEPAAGDVGYNGLVGEAVAAQDTDYGEEYPSYGMGGGFAEGSVVDVAPFWHDSRSFWSPRQQFASDELRLMESAGRRGMPLVTAVHTPREVASFNAVLSELRAADATKAYIATGALLVSGPTAATNTSSTADTKDSNATTRRAGGSDGGSDAVGTNAEVGADPFAALARRFYSKMFPPVQAAARDEAYCLARAMDDMAAELPRARRIFSEGNAGRLAFFRGSAAPPPAHGGSSDGGAEQGGAAAPPQPTASATHQFFQLDIVRNRHGGPPSKKDVIASSLDPSPPPPRAVSPARLSPPPAPNGCEGDGEDAGADDGGNEEVDATAVGTPSAPSLVKPKPLPFAVSLVVPSAAPQSAAESAAAEEARLRDTVLNDPDYAGAQQEAILLLTLGWMEAIRQTYARSHETAIILEKIRTCVTDVLFNALDAAGVYKSELDSIRSLRLDRAVVSLQHELAGRQTALEAAEIDAALRQEQLEAAEATAAVLRDRVEHLQSQVAHYEAKEEARGEMMRQEAADAQRIAAARRRREEEAERAEGGRKSVGGGAGGLFGGGFSTSYTPAQIERFRARRRRYTVDVTGKLPVGDLSELDTALRIAEEAHTADVRARRGRAELLLMRRREEEEELRRRERGRGRGRTLSIVAGEGAPNSGEGGASLSPSSNNNGRSSVKRSDSVLALLLASNPTALEDDSDGLDTDEVVVVRDAHVQVCAAEEEGGAEALFRELQRFLSEVGSLVGATDRICHEVYGTADIHDPSPMLWPAVRRLEALSDSLFGPNERAQHEADTASERAGAAMEAAAEADEMALAARRNAGRSVSTTSLAAAAESGGGSGALRAVSSGGFGVVSTGTSTRGSVFGGGGGGPASAASNGSDSDADGGHPTSQRNAAQQRNAAFAKANETVPRGAYIVPQWTHFEILHSANRSLAETTRRMRGLYDNKSFRQGLELRAPRHGQDACSLCGRVDPDPALLKAFHKFETMRTELRATAIAADKQRRELGIATKALEVERSLGLTRQEELEAIKQQLAILETVFPPATGDTLLVGAATPPPLGGEGGDTNSAAAAEGEGLANPPKSPSLAMPSPFAARKPSAAATAFDPLSSSSSPSQPSALSPALAAPFLSLAQRLQRRVAAVVSARLSAKEQETQTDFGGLLNSAHSGSSYGGWPSTPRAGTGARQRKVGGGGRGGESDAAAGGEGTASASAAFDRLLGGPIAPRPPPQQSAGTSHQPPPFSTYGGGGRARPLAGAGGGSGNSSSNATTRPQQSSIVGGLSALRPQSQGQAARGNPQSVPPKSGASLFSAAPVGRGGGGMAASEDAHTINENVQVLSTRGINARNEDGAEGPRDDALGSGGEAVAALRSDAAAAAAAVRFGYHGGLTADGVPRAPTSVIKLIGNLLRSKYAADVATLATADGYERTNSPPPSPSAAGGRRHSPTSPPLSFHSPSSLSSAIATSSSSATAAAVALGPFPEHVVQQMQRMFGARRLVQQHTRNVLSAVGQYGGIDPRVRLFGLFVSEAIPLAAAHWALRVASALDALGPRYDPKLKGAASHGAIGLGGGDEEKHAAAVPLDMVLHACSLVFLAPHHVSSSGGEATTGPHSPFHHSGFGSSSGGALGSHVGGGGVSAARFAVTSPSASAHLHASALRGLAIDVMRLATGLAVHSGGGAAAIDANLFGGSVHSANNSSGGSGRYSQRAPHAWNYQGAVAPIVEAFGDGVLAGSYFAPTPTPAGKGVGRTPPPSAASCPPTPTPGGTMSIGLPTAEPWRYEVPRAAFLCELALLLSRALPQPTHPQSDGPPPPSSSIADGVDSAAVPPAAVAGAEAIGAAKAREREESREGGDAAGPLKRAASTSVSVDDGGSSPPAPNSFDSLRRSSDGGGGGRRLSFAEAVRLTQAANRLLRRDTAKQLQLQQQQEQQQPQE